MPADNKKRIVKLKGKFQNEISKISFSNKQPISESDKSNWFSLLNKIVEKA